ncbi:hypothetical protein Agub_g872, partial [Astrephomene gubernaculifera]
GYLQAAAAQHSGPSALSSASSPQAAGLLWGALSTARGSNDWPILHQALMSCTASHTTQQLMQSMYGSNASRHSRGPTGLTPLEIARLLGSRASVDSLATRQPSYGESPHSAFNGGLGPLSAGSPAGPGSQLLLHPTAPSGGPPTNLQNLFIRTLTGDSDSPSLQPLALPLQLHQSQHGRL